MLAGKQNVAVGGAMPKLPFKRTPASEPVVLDTYIPSQTVDYTVLPPLENDDAERGLRRLPPPLRIALLVLPLLLVLGGAWALWGYLTNAPEPQIVQTPSVAISSARVVSRDAIMVEAQSQHVADGTPVRAQVLANEQPVDWTDPASMTGTVQNGRVSLRLQKSDLARTLDPNSTYRVVLNIGDGTPIASAQADVAVPLQIADAFFAVATPTPVPPTATSEASRAPLGAPTAVPSSEPSLAPIAAATSTPITMKVSLQSTVLVSPTLGSAEIGTIEAGASIAPIARSDDSKWLLVRHQYEDWQVGWLQAKNVAADANIGKVRSVKPDPDIIAAFPLKAQVGNGGNIRYTPDLRSGTVLGQLHAGQTVGLAGKSANSVWYYVFAPEAEGWVHSSLLTITPDVAAQVEVK